MLNILLCGCGGRMGAAVAAAAEAAGDRIVAGVDINPAATSPYPVFTSPDEFVGKADAIIDFSHHSALGALLSYATKTGTPLVVCTTGHTEEELAAIRAAATEIPIFLAANMSFGVALLVELAKQAVAAMPEADIEIVEKHHNRKLDAPSGTALMLAEEICRVREGAYPRAGRSGKAKRKVGEIGIHAVRLGNIIGEHEVMIGTESQTITLKHEAHSRALFAEGALAAAAFLVTVQPGLYDMKSLLDGCQREVAFC